MLIRKPDEFRYSDITPREVYLRRREFIRAATGLAAGAAGALALPPWMAGLLAQRGEKLKGVRPSPLSTTNEKINSYEDITTYNNFYEFGTDKRDPSRNSGNFDPRPWTVNISGHVNKPGDYQLEDILRPVALEDRVYRLRCVEAWSMVIPWRGFPLYELINRVEPTGNARFVEFRTIVRPEEMPGQRQRILQWPYVEGLRMDEAMHPLTLMVTGVYGLDLPNQNGAPLRLIVPWKYGFKGVKSIVSMRFVEEMPLNTWQQENSYEYGFYANVNPEVDHPRWSQARERRLPGLFANRPTLMFNGYADQVAHMYAGMDLARWK
jgi:sulfoxide reductase catalytic subunit YedY